MTRLGLLALVVLAGCELAVGDEHRVVGAVGDAGSAPASSASAARDAGGAMSPDAAPPPPPACTVPQTCLAALGTCVDACAASYQKCTSCPAIATADCKTQAECDMQLSMCRTECINHCADCGKCPSAATTCTAAATP